MYQGMHSARSHRKYSKRYLLIASLVLLLGVTIGGTVAYLMDSTNQVENTFIPAYVTPVIQETVTDSAKQDVTIRNDSNISAYIRARVLVSWTKDGKVIQKPENCTASITGPDSGWIQNGDYYYYTTPVPAGGVTSELIPLATFSDPDNTGAKLRIDILAEAIQAEPATTVQSSWNVTMSGTTITGVN